MVTLIPLSCFILLIFWRYHHTQSWREAVLSAALVWGVLVVFLTESLSIGQELTFWGVLAAWGLVLGLLVGVMVSHKVRLYFAPTRIRIFWQKFSWIEKIWLLGILLVVGVTGIIALAAPPNTWDAVSYHLPRVVFWEQYHTVAPYPTHTHRQIYQPPFAEFIILHLQLLAGSDRLANIGQWAALILTSIGVSAIAKQLGANRMAQLLSAVLCVSLPIGVLQATGAKNDLITAFWIVCLTYYVLKAIQSTHIHHRGTENTEDSQRKNFFVSFVPSWFVFYVGTSAGLALLTKGTAYPFIVPLLIWFFATLFWRNLSPQYPITTNDNSTPKYRIPQAIPLKSLLLVGGIIILLNSGHWLRNLSIYGTPLTAPDHSHFYANEIISPAVFISNMTRNVALHVFIPEQVNRIVDISGGLMQVITSLHQTLGLDISDPRTTFPLDTFKLPPIWDMFNEDRAGNPLHVGLLGLALLLLPNAYKNLPPKPPARSDLTPLLAKRGGDVPMQWGKHLIFYLLVILSTFVLFSLMLKWQQWGTRLQLPFFVLIAPFMAIVLTMVLPRWLNFLIGMVLLLTAAFIAMNGVPRALFASTDTHPLALSFYIGNENIDHESVLVQPRHEQYFNSRYEWYPPSADIAQRMKTLDCQTVGFISGENGWLYPMLLLLKSEIPGLYMQSVNVENETAKLAQLPPFVNFVPCAIIEIRGQQPDLPDHIISDGNSYYQHFRNGLYSIYLPEN